MKWMAAALLGAFLLLQYRLWLSNDGVREVMRLQKAVAAQQAENERLMQRNRELAAEVRDLKTGDAAIEERARSSLGMVSGNETYYQLVPRSHEAAPAANDPADGMVPADPASPVEEPRRTAAVR